MQHCTPLRLCRDLWRRCQLWFAHVGVLAEQSARLRQAGRGRGRVRLAATRGNTYMYGSLVTPAPWGLRGRSFIHMYATMQHTAAASQLAARPSMADEDKPQRRGRARARVLDRLKKLPGADIFWTAVDPVLPSAVRAPRHPRS